MFLSSSESNQLLDLAYSRNSLQATINSLGNDLLEVYGVTLYQLVDNVKVIIVLIQFSLEFLQLFKVRFVEGYIVFRIQDFVFGFAIITSIILFFVD